MKYKEIHEINEICGEKKTVLVGESAYGVARHRSKRMVASAIPIQVVTQRAKEARRVEQRESIEIHEFYGFHGFHGNS